MKFACEQTPLAYALQKCASVSRPSSTFLGNRNIRIDARADGLVLTATDTISTTVSYRVPVAEVEEQGYILVDGASLSAFVGAQKSYIRANSTPQNKLHVTSGVNKMFLRSSDHEFLPVKYPADNLVASMRGDTLKELLKISVMADTGNIVRPFLTGIMLWFDNKHTYAMAASSGRAGYAWSKMDYESKGKFLLPPLSASRLSYFLHDNDMVKLYRKDTKLFLVTERFAIASSEIAGNYPAKEVVEMCSAEQQHKITVSASELVAVLGTCSAMYQGTKDNTLKRIHFKVDGEYRILNVSTADENEIGKMDLTLAVSEIIGQPFGFKLNAMFVDTVLGVLEKMLKSDLMYSGSGDFINIGTSEKTSFIYFSSSDLRAIFTIAPLGAPWIEKATDTTDTTDVDDRVF